MAAMKSNKKDSFRFFFIIIINNTILFSYKYKLRKKLAYGNISISIISDKITLLTSVVSGAAIGLCS